MYKSLISILGIITATITIISFVLSNPFILSKELNFKIYTEKILFIENKSDSISIRLGKNEIENIWKIKFLMTNSGKDIIVGKGSFSDVYNDTIKISVESPFEVFSYRLINNDVEGDISFTNNNTFNISFHKWNPNEKVEMEALLSNYKNNYLIPNVYINDRDLIRIKTTTNSINLNELTFNNDLNWLIIIKSYIPNFILKIFKYFTMFMGFAFCTAPFYVIYTSISSNIMYAKWHKKHIRKFIKELSSLNLTNELVTKYKSKPYSIPNDLKNCFSMRIPEKPETFWGTLFPVIFSIFAFCPYFIIVLFVYYHL
ncbi:hypothetical protein [Capnocytophaga canimorsus]|uniref:hypothetical protein n=1 Tax=Capnocytophaga canimorsus TaxID=28188 RepID=UPI001EDF5E5F|nr:hypothetical protein [Capnocytophaga canimorsus]GJQ04004.1 hypothetical protein CAPN009_04190 [Capnocytophaga canimorsus]